MKKIFCASQNTEAKTLPADVYVFIHSGWLSPVAVHSADGQYESRVKRWIFVSSIVTYLCKNSFLLCWNSCKQRSELLTCRCFGLTVSKCSTHFEHIFLIDKCTSKMMNTLPSNIFNFSAISHNFNLRSTKTSLWSFLVFSVTTDEFEWPDGSASFVSVCLHLKSAYHLLTIVSNGAESEYHLLS